MTAKVASTAMQEEKSGNTNPGTDGYLFSKRSSWWIFFLLFSLMIFDFIDRTVISTLFPFFKTEWGISDVQCGLLVAVLSWAITIFALPVGIVADRWSRKNIIGIMSSIWGLASLACAFVTGYIPLLIARFLVGAGEAGYAPVGNSMIATIFPQRLRARLIGLFLGAAPLGIAIGTVVGGFIAHKYGWRHAFGLVALPGLIFAVLFFFVRDFKTVALTKSVVNKVGTTEKQAMTKKDILQIFKNTPSLLTIYGGAVMSNFFIAGVLTWLPSFFMREHNMTVAQAGMKTGIILVGSILGNILGGWLADKLVSRGIISGRPLAAAVAQFCCLLIFPIAFIFTQGTTQYVLLFLGGLIITAQQAPSASGVMEIVHPGMRSSAVAVQVVLQNLLGQALGPIFVGAISDRYGLLTGLAAISFVPIISVTLYMIAASTYKKDMAKLGKVVVQA